MYTYGTQYYLIVLAEAVVSVTMATVYLPVFFKLQITSSYEVTGTATVSGAWRGLAGAG